MSAKEPCPGLCERCGAECIMGTLNQPQPYLLHVPESRPTKREQFAAMALQGLLATDEYTPNHAVELAVEAADLLIAALNKADSAR